MNKNTIVANHLAKAIQAAESEARKLRQAGYVLSKANIPHDESALYDIAEIHQQSAHWLNKLMQREYGMEYDFRTRSAVDVKI